MKGIDVSLWQGDINWNSVKNSDVKFAMIKATQDQNIVDPQFERNIIGAYDAGLLVGTYHYFTAVNEVQADIEAQHFIDTITPYRELIDLWCSVDVESPESAELDRDYLTSLVIRFMDKVAEAGFKPMLYTNTAYISYHYNFDRLKNYPLWYACWYDAESENDKPIRDYDYKIWQHGVVNVSGIYGQVDGDFGYFDESEFDREFITAGDTIGIRQGALYYGTDIQVPEFVLDRNWIVESVDGNRVVINADTTHQYAINSAIYLKDAYLIVEDPVEEPINDPVEEPINDPVEEPVVQDPVEEPDKPEDPIEDPVETPIETPVEDPVEDDEDEKSVNEWAKFFKNLLKGLLIAIRSIFGKRGD